MDNAGNIGPLSAERAATTGATADTTPPVQVAGLAVTTASSTQLNLSWTQNTELDLNHYNVYRGTTAGFLVTLGTTTPVTNASTDTTIPSVAITSPANNASLPRGSILVQGTASDNPGGSGIFDVQVRTDNNPWVLATPQSAGNWATWSITVQLPTPGQHFIQARATDKANNMMWYDTFVNIT